MLSYHNSLGCKMLQGLDEKRWSDLMLYHCAESNVVKEPDTAGLSTIYHILTGDRYNQRYRLQRQNHNRNILSKMDERKKNLLVNAATNKVWMSLYPFSIILGHRIQVNPFLGNRRAVSVQRTVGGYIWSRTPAPNSEKSGVSQHKSAHRMMRGVNAHGGRKPIWCRLPFSLSAR